ncbi:MAG TPA: helix-turn-helix domain-containing protein [Solirubrobacteraceae bacterium]|nr:helix-turn-helix domain-containing protein [Solirubrobacteraceae bacterium]
MALDEVRADIGERLQGRIPEIVQAIYVCILDAVPDPIAGLGADYQVGVLAAITAIVEYSLEGIKQEPGWSAPIPQAAAAQVRLAARVGVSVGTVVRRYIAGHGCLGKFIAREVEQIGLSGHGPTLHHLHRTQEVLLQNLTAAIEHEYNQECERARSPEQRRADVVQKLLADEAVGPAELAELDYEFHASWHLAVIVTGAGAKDALRRLEVAFSNKLLPVSFGDKTVWIWIGSQRKPAVTDVERALSINRATGVSLAIGEPGRGIDGWRLTHHQAQGAWWVALRMPEKLIRYKPFRAAAIQDDTLARSLKQKHLAPLASQRDGGAVLRQTLRAYIDAHGSATSAGNTLKVDRHTVESRLRTVEDLIGCALYTCLAEVDVALFLEELDGADADDPPPTQ